MYRTWLLLGATTLSFGCEPAKIELDIDSDADGLLTSEELDIGTDPDNPDSDGDGHSDGSEANIGFDPLDMDDHPYLGEYPVARCEPAVTGTGYGPGDISNDFELMDQFGEMVKLSDFCGDVVVLVAAAFWWGGCHAEAAGLEAWYIKYSEQGFIPITLLSEDDGGSPVDQQDLEEWANMHNLTHPVLADTSSIAWNYIQTGLPAGSGGYGLPNTQMLIPGMVVEITNGHVSASDIENHLPN